MNMLNNKKPLDMLNTSLNENVIIGVKGGVEFSGTLLAYDIHMNVALANAQQIIGGEVKKKLGNVVIRGDSIVYVSPTVKYRQENK